MYVPLCVWVHAHTDLHVYTDPYIHKYTYMTAGTYINKLKIHILCRHVVIIYTCHIVDVYVYVGIFTCMHRILVIALTFAC